MSESALTLLTHGTCLLVWHGCINDCHVGFLK